VTLRVVEAGQVGNGGLSKTGVAVVSIIVLLGGALLIPLNMVNSLVYERAERVARRAE